MKLEKKRIILLGLIIVIIIGTYFIIKITEKNKIEASVETSSTVSYDEATKLYYIKNEVTGEIISASQNEDELEFYKDNPEYNPNPLQEKTNSLEDYANLYFYSN